MPFNNNYIGEITGGDLIQDLVNQNYEKEIIVKVV